jgi:hypothetical protein
MMVSTTMPHRLLSILALVLVTTSCGSPDRPPAAAEEQPAGRGTGQPPAAVVWTVTPRGAGPLVAGMTVAEAERAAGVALVGFRDDECAYLRPTPGPPGLLIMSRAGRIARVDVVGTDVTTDAGVRVGDREDRVREAHGTVARSPHKYTDGHYLTVADGDHRLVFEIDGGRVARFRSGRLPEVEWVEGCS